MSEQLFAVQENGRWGFIDVTGTIRIPLQFAEAYSFSDGLGRVRISQKSGNLSTGFVNASGDFVIEPTPPRGFAIPHEWREHWIYSDFHNGRAVFTYGDIQGRRGFIDKTGKLVTSVDYVRAADFSEGLACVSILGRRRSVLGPLPTGFIDVNGAYVIPPEEKYSAGEFSEGMCSVALELHASDALQLGQHRWRHGFIDRQGRQIVPMIYNGASSFAEGLARVTRIQDEDALCGFIDSLGRIRIPLEYSGSSSHFGDGRICVATEDRCMIIDRYGNAVTSLAFDPERTYFGSFRDGIAYLVQNRDNGRRCGFINVDGEVIIPCEYDFVSDFKGGLAHFEKQTRSGYLNMEGKVVWESDDDL